MRIGIFWYRSADDYNKLLSIFTDSQKLPGTYEDWLAQAEEAECNLRRHGDIPVRAYCEPWDFVPWCYSHDTYVNAKGREAYIDWFLAGGRAGEIERDR